MRATPLIALCLLLVPATTRADMMWWGISVEQHTQDVWVTVQDDACNDHVEIYRKKEGGSERHLFGGKLESESGCTYVCVEGRAVGKWYAGEDCPEEDCPEGWTCSSTCNCNAVYVDGCVSPGGYTYRVVDEQFENSEPGAEQIATIEVTDWGGHPCLDDSDEGGCAMGRGTANLLILLLGFLLFIVPLLKTRHPSA